MRELKHKFRDSPQINSLYAITKKAEDLKPFVSNVKYKIRRSGVISLRRELKDSIFTRYFFTVNRLPEN